MKRPSDAAVPVILEVDPAAPEAVALIAALDEDLTQRYPGMPINGIDPDEFRRAGGVFLIAMCEGYAVACGAIRPVSDGVGELKRMFVHAGARRRGYARAMLDALERVAIERGYRAVVLETGCGQPEAIALYQNAGYRPIPPYGQFVSDDRARCFEKLIRAAPVREL